MISIAVQKDRGLWKRDWEALKSSNNANARHAQITAQAGHFSVFYFFIYVLSGEVATLTSPLTFVFFSLKKTVN